MSGQIRISGVLAPAFTYEYGRHTGSRRRAGMRPGDMLEVDGTIYQDYGDEDSSYAMWQLIDRQTLQLTATRTLALVHPY